MSLLGFVLYSALIFITMDTVSCHSCLWRPAEINRRQRIPFSSVSITTDGNLLCLVSVYDQNSQKNILVLSCRPVKVLLVHMIQANMLCK